MRGAWIGLDLQGVCPSDPSAPGARLLAPGRGGRQYRRAVRAGGDAAGAGEDHHGAAGREQRSSQVAGTPPKRV